MRIACYTLRFVIIHCVAIDVIRSTARSAALTWAKHCAACSVILRYAAMQLFEESKHYEEVPRSIKDPALLLEFQALNSQKFVQSKHNKIFNNVKLATCFGYK